MKPQRLTTIAEIVAATNPQNLDNFMKDFRAFLELSHVAVQCNKASGGRINYDPSYIDWVDDGKNNINLNVTVQ